MTAVPAAGYPSNSARTQGDIKTYEETMLTLYKEVFGGSPKQTLTLDTNGKITPVAGCSYYALDTFAAASTDQLDNFFATNLRDGQMIAFCGANNAHIVTIRNAQGASLNFVLSDTADFQLESTKDFIAFIYSTGGSGTLTELFRSDTIRSVRLAGASVETVTGIVSDAFTPSTFMHSLSCETGTPGTATDNVSQIAQTTPYLKNVIIHPETVGDIISVTNNTGGTGKLLTKDGQTRQLTHPNEFLWAQQKGTTWEEIMSFPHFPIEYIFSGGRINSSNTVADSAAGGTTCYLLPFGQHGKWLSGLRGSKWIPSPLDFSSPPSVAYPNVKFCGGWVHAYLGTDNKWNLEIERWDGGSQVTGSVSSVTIANPAVVTTGATHGLSVGDWVAFDGGAGTAFTDSSKGLNSNGTFPTNFFRITATPSGTTFTLGGHSTSGLASSTATWYKVPQPTALALKDGIPTKTGDSTRRCVGGFYTGYVAGTVNTGSNGSMIVSLLNPITKSFSKAVNAFTLNSSGVNIPMQDYTNGLFRALAIDVNNFLRIEHQVDLTNGSTSFPTLRVAIDSLDGSNTWNTPPLQVSTTGGTNWKAAAPFSYVPTLGIHLFALIGQTSSSQNNTVNTSTAFFTLAV